MSVENTLQALNLSSFGLSSSPSTLILQCEKLLSFIFNRTAFLSNQKSPPPYIQDLLTKQNLSLRFPKTVPECVIDLSRILNNTNEVDISKTATQQTYDLHEHSRSLIVFVFFIAFVSFISIIGNLCLAKVLYAKRLRLSQTDRIVLCLAISELCLVLIDSPAEIYRFLSFSFSQTWLCRYHTFFESFFASCIIFYHLLGAFDRFVYIHGHTPSNTSSMSKWCRRISTKSGSIILLTLPIFCSLPIAICNLLHAHVLHTTSKIKICIVQYTHGILISFLAFFYILPILFSFFFHAKLIYFIRSKHTQHYLPTTPHILPKKGNNTLDSQMIGQRKQRTQNQNMFINNQQLIEPKNTNRQNENRRLVMFNIDKKRNTAGTLMTTTTAAAQQVGKNNSSNSSASTHSSSGTGYTSLPSPIILYKINSQANANAKRTVLLLVLLLSFYVLCWAPYNIYTWHHAYQLAADDQNQNFFNRTVSYDFNLATTSLTDNLHANLRRIIFINYSLYLLSMISMCFSFIFYFALNKQARHEFSHVIGCICPRFIDLCKEKQGRRNPVQEYEGIRPLQYHPRYQHQYSQNNQILISPQNNNNRVKTIKFNTHPMIVPPTPLPVDRQNNKKHVNSLSPKAEDALSKRTVLTYGCHVQCCQ